MTERDVECTQCGEKFPFSDLICTLCGRGANELCLSHLDKLICDKCLVRESGRKWYERKEG